MARTTISLPDALKQRMDAVKDPVNWSQVAAHAFELKLGEIASRRESTNMNEVIQRLRASKIVHEDDQTKAGFKEGEAWAKKRATWAQLERLAGQDIDWNDNNEDPNWADIVLATIEGDRGLDRGAIRDFWEDMAPTMASRTWFEGFVDGACAVHKAVSDHV